jgi:hypothetical protein
VSGQKDEQNGMTKRYRKAARKRNRDHGGIVEVAAQICGRSLSMVYKVRNGNATSAVVQRAIEEAERLLREEPAA